MTNLVLEGRCSSLRAVEIDRVSNPVCTLGLMPGIDAAHLLDQHGTGLRVDP